MSETTLGEACERVDYGYTASSTVEHAGPRFLRITDIERSHVDWASVPFCAATAHDREKFALATGDIVVARTGASTGRSQWIELEEPAVFASYLVRFRVHPQFDSRYVAYVLQSAGWLDYVNSEAHGKSAQPNMSAASMAAFTFSYPSLPEQQAIAEVLGALDDKIAANTALTTKADSLMRAEYLALANGRRVSVSEVAISPRAGVDPTSIEPRTPYVGLEHIARRSMWLGESGYAADVKSGKSRFEQGDVLFGKLRPYFHKVAMASTHGVCSTDILVVRAKEPGLSSVLLAALSSDEVIDAVVAASEGTRMPRTSWKDLAATEINWPTAPEVTAVAHRLDAIAARAQMGYAENRTLAATRDALLPQLMSGKLRVRDAEAAASEAGV